MLSISNDACCLVITLVIQLRVQCDLVDRAWSSVVRSIGVSKYSLLVCCLAEYARLSLLAKPKRTLWAVHVCMKFYQLFSMVFAVWKRHFLALIRSLQFKLIDRLCATRWTPPDYWQTDNSNGLVMVIRNYHWLNSASWVLISTCSAPLVETGERKQFSLFDLDLWPITLTYTPRLAKIKINPHA